MLTWVLLTLIGAVAVIVEFISAVIQVIRLNSVAGCFVFFRCLDQTFLSSTHIVCSLIDSMWLLSISPGQPTFFRVL